MKISNIFKHLYTICKHKHLVFIHCCKCGIPIQGILHDLSKFSLVEFWNSVKYYQGTRSPNVAERINKGYSSSWLHHKGRNKHHFEYWIDYPSDGSERIIGTKMPIKYVVEMFCDRISACKTYNKEKYTNGDALNYYIKNKKYNVIHKDTERLLIDLLTRLSLDGERKTFSYIKNYVLKNKIEY